MFMRGSTIINFFDKNNISRTIRFFLYVLVFFQPFNHFNSFREVSFYALLLLFLIKISRRELKTDFLKDAVVIAIVSILGWSLLVSIAGPFPAESLTAIRKNLLKHAVVVLITISEFKNFRDMKNLLTIVVFSFTAVTIASLVENAVRDWPTLVSLAPSISWRTVSHYYFANYADNATFYLPFIAVWLVSAKEVSWKKWTGIFTLILGGYLVYIYNGRTQLLAVIISIMVIFLLTKHYRVVFAFVIAGVLFVSLVCTTNNEGLLRYKTLFNTETYTSDTGLTNRLGLWQVVIEFIEDRPLTGYGYGWKKLAWLVQEKNSEEYWKEKLPSAYTYYIEDAKLMYGRVNPHNLVLQIVFEIGLVGLAIFIIMWGAVLRNIFKTLKVKDESEGHYFMLGCIGVIISYAMVNVTTGMWQESYGMMIFLFIAVIIVVSRDLSSKKSLL